MSSQFRLPPVAPKTSVRPVDSTVSDGTHNDNSELLYDDVIQVKAKIAQRVPPPVAARSKQHTPSVRGQTMRYSLDTKSFTRTPPRGPPVVVKSLQRILPATGESSIPNDSDTISTKHMTKPPVTTRKQYPSQATNDTPLYDDTVLVRKVVQDPPEKLTPPVTSKLISSATVSCAKDTSLSMYGNMHNDDQLPKTYSQAKDTSLPTYGNIHNDDQLPKTYSQTKDTSLSTDGNMHNDDQLPKTYSQTKDTSLSMYGNIHNDDQLPKTYSQAKDTSLPTYGNDGQLPKPDSQFKLPSPRVTRALPQEINTSGMKYVNAVPRGVCKMTELRSFNLPRLVQIFSGCCGNKNYPMASLSEGEKLIVLFTKKATIVPAHRPGNDKVIYHIPLCSTFEFGLIDDQPNGDNFSFTSISDILSHTKSLPKVVKVLKACVGKTEESSVPAGVLIFPQKIITGKKGKQNLVCTNSANHKTLMLSLPCVGKFSTHPSDVKMSILHYVSYISKFPVTVQVYNANRTSGESYIEMGASFVLNRPTSVISYICTKDISGKNNHPMLEVHTEAPVLVQCIDCDNMSSLFDTAKRLYNSFSMSMIESHIPICEDACFEIQDEFYKEITSTVCGANKYYELVCPVEEHNYEYVAIRHKPLNSTSSVPLPHSPKKVSRLFSFPNDGSPIIPVKMSAPTAVHPQEMLMPRQSQETEEKNKVYLQSLSRKDILKLLDNMNLSQHKASFQQEQVNGIILATLSNDDLIELGVTKAIQRKRLMCLITGAMSAKDLLEDSSYY